MRFEILRDQVHDHESWAEAADRLSPDGGPVLALDLSGDPLQFRLDHEHTFSVRPMTPGDFPEVARWVNEPHVARWWGEETRTRRPANAAERSSASRRRVCPSGIRPAQRRLRKRRGRKGFALRRRCWRRRVRWCKVYK